MGAAREMATSQRLDRPQPVQLCILIPCFNEVASLADTITELRLHLPDSCETVILVIDDGSTDGSAQVAAACAVQVVQLPHRGLAQTYAAGLKAALALGADYVISLDADGQYDPAAIPAVFSTLQAGRADVVLIERDTHFYQRLSWSRRQAHRLGRWGVSWVTGLALRDPVSGFRGYNRRALTGLELHTHYSYTLETLVQLPLLRLRLATLCAPARLVTRPSRLFKHPAGYILRQLGTLLWAAAYYRTRQLGLWRREHALTAQRKVSAE